MKKIHLDMKNREAKLKIESLEDLWYLAHIVDPGDLVSSKTTRKLKLGSGEDRSTKSVKKTVFLKLKVEKVEFSRHSSELRVSGTVVEGPEDIPGGSHHTLNIEEGTIFKIKKERWLRFQLDKLKEATSSTAAKILMCVMDREEAFFALMKSYGYEVISSMKGTVQKKAIEDSVKASFYAEIRKQLEDYDKRYGFDAIIIASPSFWKEDLMKEIKDKTLRSKIVLATCSSVTKNSFDELLKRGEVQSALDKDKIAKEVEIVERLLDEISKEGNAAYGLDEVKKASDAAAISDLLLTDTIITDSREDDSYEKLDSMMKSVDQAKGTIYIISTDHEAGKKLKGLGSIAALLRYKFS